MRPHQGAETARGLMPAAHTQLRAALQGEGCPRAGEHGGDGGFGGAALRLATLREEGGLESQRLQEVVTCALKPGVSTDAHGSSGCGPGHAFEVNLWGTRTVPAGACLPSEVQLL